MSLLTNQLDPAVLAAELDEKGFVCIENAIDPGWMERAQAHVRELVEQKRQTLFLGQRSVALPGHTTAGTHRRSADASADAEPRPNRLSKGEVGR